MATASKAAKKSAQPEEGAAPKDSRKMLFLILGAALILAIGGGGAMYFFLTQGQAAQHSGAQKPALAKPPVFMSLETFTVNLQYEDGQQFLQVNLTLQLGDEANVEQVRLHMPQVRNRLLLLLSSKKVSEITSVEGKKKLAAEIIEQIKLPFTPQGPEQNVSDVFFTSFVIQ